MRLHVIRAAPPQRREAVLAQAGLWYDAVGATRLGVPLRAAWFVV
jgi:hypothetical protein